MEFQTLFFITQSIFAIAGTIVFVAFIILVYYIYKSVKNIKLKAENAINEGYQAAHEARDYASKIGRSILDYFIVRIFKNVKK